MATVAIRSDDAYVGLGKQAVQGTAVAPTIFPRWFDGSSIEIDLKAEDVREGDGSRRLSTIIKNLQQAKIKLVCTPRPIEAGFLEQAALGAGADTPTAAATSTTTSGASNTAGSTSLTLVANTGLTSSGSATLMIEPGTANEEIVTVTTPGTGAGPFVYTITAPATGLAFTHTAGVAVRSATLHVETDQPVLSYFSVEIGLGSLNSQGGQTFRVRDCVVESLKRSGKAGGLLMYEVELVGLVTVQQGSPSTVTLEAHAPILFVNGVWTLDGVTTGDALNVESFDLTTKDNADLVQTEGLTGVSLIGGKLDVAATFMLVYQATSTYVNRVYFGGAVGTTDSQTLYTGSLTLLFTSADGFHTVQYKVLTLAYTKVTMPVPKADGKHFTFGLQATSTSAQGANAYVIQTTVGNSQTAAY